MALLLLCFSRRRFSGHMVLKSVCPPCKGYPIMSRGKMGSGGSAVGRSPCCCCPPGLLVGTTTQAIVIKAAINHYICVRGGAFFHHGDRNDSLCFAYQQKTLRGASWKHQACAGRGRRWNRPHPAPRPSAGTQPPPLLDLRTKGVIEWL